MPALDSCEPPIIRAFQKDGWQIVRKPQYIPMRMRTLYADVSLSRNNNGTTEEIIVVEVKCFGNPDRDIEEFYSAVGQYVLYRTALSLIPLRYAVFLALPEIAFERLSIEPALIEVFNRLDVKLVVVDTEREEIVLWNR